MLVIDDLELATSTDLAEGITKTIAMVEYMRDLVKRIEKGDVEAVRQELLKMITHCSPTSLGVIPTSIATQSELVLKQYIDECEKRGIV